MEIEKVLNREQNEFEPGKNIEYDKSYAGDQFQYLYQKEEKDLQDQLFEAYDKIVDEPAEDEDDEWARHL